MASGQWPCSEPFCFRALGLGRRPRMALGCAAQQAVCMSHGVPVRLKSLFYLGLLLAVTAGAGAQGVDLRQVPGTGGASDGFLKPDQAFVLTAESESPDRVTLR